MSSGYYDDTRFCTLCRTYVHYLLSPTRAYCVRCLGPVALFSERDRRQFEFALRSDTGRRAHSSALEEAGAA